MHIRLCNCHNCHTFKSSQFFPQNKVKLILNIIVSKSRHIQFQTAQITKAATSDKLINWNV